ncbi:glycosyltransferase family 4 protein [Georgenia wangjunii]|uniref:glycosyltransferase family 4 protein n=1 Tax=Georgenia wangjunii TaxID=3117730 RepID=UPI002F268842
MRVVYVCTDPGIPALGRKGASVHVQAVLRVLLAAGADVHLVCARVGGEVPPDLTGLTVHRLPRVSGESSAEREVAAAASDAAVGATLDAIAASGPVDLVYERYALWGRTAMAWAAGYGAPSLLEVNAPLVEEQARHRVLVDRRGAEAVAASAFTDAGAIVCVSDAVAEWVRPRTAGVVRTVANGVDTTRFRPAAALTPAHADAFTVGFVGTLKPWHGVESLVEAMALLVREDPTYRLLLVGDGPQAGPLAARAEALGLTPYVEVTGAVDPADVPGLLRRIDVATAPYPALEDFYFSPLKVYEYLAAGLPVVASRIGVLPEVLDDGRLGVLVEPGDPRALADAVAALRADAGTRARLRRDTVADAAAHDWTSVVAESLGLVGLALPDRPARAPSTPRAAVGEAHHALV